MSIYQLKKRASCTIEKLPQLPLLRSLGLREGLKVRVLTRQPFGGPVVVSMGNRSIAIAKDVAQQIAVKEVF